MPRGGYRKPGNPAPVSGPGKLSRRTDGGPGSKQAQRIIPSNGEYGYATETAAATSGAPLAGKATSITPVTPLMAPDQYPDRPVTHGASVGPGFTPDPQIPERYSMINKYADQLNTVAAQQDTPPAFQAFWNYVKATAMDKP